MKGKHHLLSNIVQTKRQRQPFGNGGTQSYRGYRRYDVCHARQLPCVLGKDIRAHGCLFCIGIRGGELLWVLKIG
jgi:hypothetical protein